MGALDDTKMEFNPQSGHAATTHAASTEPAKTAPGFKNWMALDWIPRTLFQPGKNEKSRQLVYLAGGSFQFEPTGGS